MSLAEAKPPAAAGKIPTADELIARARALAPKLRERAIKAERDRNIPRESVEEYIDSGLIHALQPKRPTACDRCNGTEFGESPDCRP